MFGGQKIQRVGFWHPTQQAAMGKPQEMEHVVADLKRKAKHTKFWRLWYRKKGVQSGQAVAPGLCKQEVLETAGPSSVPLSVPRAGGQVCTFLLSP